MKSEISTHKLNMERLMTQMDLLKKEIRSAERAWIEAEAQYKIDDIVVANGYSYKGSKMQVKYVGVKKDYLSDWCFYARGLVLKKDGTLGAREAEWRSDYKQFTIEEQT